MKCAHLLIYWSKVGGSVNWLHVKWNHASLILSTLSQIGSSGYNSGLNCMCVCFRMCVCASTYMYVKWLCVFRCFGFYCQATSRLNQQQYFFLEIINVLVLFGSFVTLAKGGNFIVKLTEREIRGNFEPPWTWENLPCINVHSDEIFPEINVSSRPFLPIWLEKCFFNDRVSFPFHG